MTSKFITTLKQIPAGAGAGARGSRWLITPDNWFETNDAANVCAERERSLELFLEGDSGSSPLSELCLRDLVPVYEVFREWWPLLGSAERASSLSVHAYADLVEGLRALVREKSEADEHGGLTFALPALDHRLNQDPDAALGFWKPLLWNHRSPSVQVGAARYARDPQVLEHCRKLPWLRVLLQKVAAESADSDVTRALRDLYGDPRDRKAMLEEESTVLARVGLGDLAAGFVDSLGLQQSLRRARPFKLTRSTQGRADSDSLVTVLIPSYCHADYIAETLESARAQSHASIQILVVDDQSSDATVAIASNVDDPRIKVRSNPENLGLGNSVLTALESIDTPYVALLNSDDLFHPQRIEKCLEVFEATPECQLVSTGIALIDAQSKRLTTRNVSQVLDGKNVCEWVQWYDRAKPRSLEPGELFGELLERNFLATSSNIVCRREYLLGHAESLRSLKYCLDWQLFLDAAREGVLIHLPEELMAYRLHASNTVWFDRGKRWRYSLEVNRVAARAIRDHIKGLPDGSLERVQCALEDLSEHVAINSETDTLGLYLNELLGGHVLDAHSQDSESVSEIVAALEDMAQGKSTEDDHVEDHGRHALEAQNIVFRDEAETLRSERDWLKNEVTGQHERLSEKDSKIQELHDRGEGLLRERDQRTEERDQRTEERDQRTEERDQLHEQNRSLQTDLTRHEAAMHETLAELEVTRQSRRDAEQALENESAKRDTAESSLYQLRATKRMEACSPRMLRGWSRRRAKWLRKLEMLRVSAAGLFRRKPKSGRLVLAAGADSQTGRRAIAELASYSRDAAFGLAVIRTIRVDAAEMPAALSIEGVREFRLYSVREHHQRDERYWRRREPERLAKLIESLGGFVARELVVECLWPYLSFARMARSLQPDLLHAAAIGEGAVAVRVASALLNIPWSISLDVFSPRGRHEQEWLLSELPTAAIVFSRSSLLSAEVGGERVIFCPELDDGVRAQPAAVPIRIRSVATPLPQSGWLDLLSVAEKLIEQGCEFVIELVGEADVGWMESLAFDERMRAEIESRGLAGRVVRFEEAPAEAASIYVGPFLDVGVATAIPRELLGAMASGIPVVVSDAKLMADLAEGARVVPQGRVDVFEEVLVKLIQSEEHREELGGRVRVGFEARFEVSGLRSATVERLRSCLEATEKPA